MLIVGGANFILYMKLCRSFDIPIHFVEQLYDMYKQTDKDGINKMPYPMSTTEI